MAMVYSETAAYLEQSRQPLVVGTSIALLILAITSVALRFVVRVVYKNGFWWDDWLILLALPLAVGVDCINFVAVKDGFGKHEAATPNALYLYNQHLYASSLLYNACLGICKYSVLLFYTRIFSFGRFQIAAIVVAGLSTAWFISTEFALMFQCIPIMKSWHAEMPGTCIDREAFFLGQGISNIVLDVIILILPIWQVRALQLSRSHKVAVCCIFLLGGFVTICSIVRLVIVFELGYVDITWNWVQVVIWTSTEASINIVSICLPTYGPLYKSILPRSMRGSYPSFYRQSHTTGRARMSLANQLSGDGQMTAYEMCRPYTTTEIRGAKSAKCSNESEEQARAGSSPEDYHLRGLGGVMITKEVKVYHEEVESSHSS